MNLRTKQINKCSKIMAVMLVLVLICYTFCGCTLIEKKDTVKAMFIPKSANSSFWNICIAGFNTAVSEFNIEGVVRAPETEEDYGKQIEFINEAIENDYKLIVLSSIHYNNTVSAIERAVSKGIAVIIIDSDVNTDKVKVRISTDNYTAGYKMGTQLVESMNNTGKVAMLEFDENTQNGLQRTSGFVDAVTASNVEIAERIPIKSNTADALKATADLLSSRHDINTVVAFNELTTVGMGMAIEANGNPFVHGFGFDNNAVVVDYIERGIFYGSTIQNQFSMGYLAVEYGMKQLKGEITKPINIDTGVNIITKANMYDTDIQAVLFPFGDVMEDPS